MAGAIQLLAVLNTKYSLRVQIIFCRQIKIKIERCHLSTVHSSSRGPDVPILKV